MQQESMENIKQIMSALSDRNLRIVSARTGISEPTLARLRDGDTPFRQSTVDKISAYLAQQNWREIMSTAIMTHFGKDAVVDWVSNDPSNANSLSFVIRGDKANTQFNMFDLPSAVTDILYPALLEAAKVSK
jgi:predicted transcriptional regulator